MLELLNIKKKLQDFKVKMVRDVVSSVNRSKEPSEIQSITKIAAFTMHEIVAMILSLPGRCSSYKVAISSFQNTAQSTSHFKRTQPR